MKTTTMMTTSSTTMTNKRTFLEWIGYALMIFCIVGLDQFTKYLSLTDLRPIDVFDLWPGVFRLNYEENTGAAFSMLSGHTWIFIVLTVLLCSFLVYLLSKGSVHSAIGRIALVFVLAGGIGNLIDRIFRGFVVDMFDFYLIDFAVFNVADIFVCCGCGLFILAFIVSKGEILD